MADIQITCIIKPDPQNAHEHITHVGSVTRTWPRERVVQWIETGEHTFYTRDAAGKRADVRVVRDSGRPPYLRTYADGRWTNNLLALPQCTLPPQG